MLTVVQEMTVTVPTPLEINDHRRISRSVEVDDYLVQLTRLGRDARASAPANESIGLEIWGHSHRGRPLRLLRCGLPAGASPGNRPKVLLIGSQHGGSEPAGCEALLKLARSLLLGDLSALRVNLDILIVPNANPDGRDDESKNNAHGVNLNRDHVLLSQPETRALHDAIRAHRPAVVLDAHESAALKRRTLWLEGYLTEFEAQFDVGNHPAIPSLRRHYGEQRILAPWCDRVNAGGLSAARYIREILSTSQALTHGGVTIRGMRNAAGVLGSLSFLLETRLDPKDGLYPSYRNIAARVAKQFTCMRELLVLLAEQAADLAQFGRQAITPVAGQAVALGADYVPVAHAPVAHIPLRRADDGERVMMEFADHRHLAPYPPIVLPAAYLVTRQTEAVGELLARHGLTFEILPASTHRVSGTAAPASIAHEPAALTIAAGTLRVATTQPDGLLVPLLLEAQSPCNLFEHGGFREIAGDSNPPDIYRAD